MYLDARNLYRNNRSYIMYITMTVIETDHTVVNVIGEIFHARVESDVTVIGGGDVIADDYGDDDGEDCEDGWRCWPL